MLIKFETNGDEVRGLSFHSKRPWILASLNTGLIQLWDYRIKILIEQFRGHDGPVRSVHFHNTRPLFVSGGDDFTIKVWNYELHRCSFTLLGHLNYVRTVQFHHELPWILSASDDLTVRIWNFDSRTCVSVLTCHKPVLCATFHPKKDLLLSAPHDPSALIWDISALRQNITVSPVEEMEGALVKNDVMKNLNWGWARWACFHPTRDIAVIVFADKFTVWRLTGAPTSTTFEFLHLIVGHGRKISCLIFPAKQDKMIISCSEDDNKMLVWALNYFNDACILATKHGRFFVLASHPKMNLLAAGRESGMIVFKLERERPAFSVSGDYLFYVKGRFLHRYQYSTQKDTELIKVRKSIIHHKTLNQGPQTLSYSPSENAVLICSAVGGGSYQLFRIALGNARGNTYREPDWERGKSAIFISKNRYAVLMRSTNLFIRSTNLVLVKNLKNVTVQESSLPSAADEIVYAGSGRLLCRGKDRVYIFDLQQEIVLGSLQTPSFVRYVVWSHDMERVALLGKQSILIADKNLMYCCTLHETARVKSGAWNENGVFIYTTYAHIKYCLPNGESGIIRSLSVPMYITKVSENMIFCLDRDGKNHPMVIDSTEYVFKMALLRKKHDQAMGIIRNSSKQCFDSKAMTAYLLQKGYAEIALFSMKDEHTRFSLAVKIGNIKIALESANKIDEKNHWDRLAVEALRHGKVVLAEYAYQKSQNFERLSFLYLITGNLEKFFRIAKVKNETMSRFRNALYLGNVGERVNVLENAGRHMLPLAYMTAKVHMLNNFTTAERLAKELGGNVPSMPKGKKASLLLPPAPISTGGDWPLLMPTNGIF